MAKRLGNDEVLGAVREGHIPNTPDGSSLGVPEGPNTKYFDLKDDGAWHEVNKSNKRIGKGDGRRPASVSSQEYADRYCKAFGHRWSNVEAICKSCGISKLAWMQAFHYRHCGDGSR